MSQSNVAKILGVTTNTVTNWELRRNEPTAKFAKSIIDFLGYFPFLVDNLSLGEQLHYARLITGKTQREVAKLIDCDASNLRHIELGKRMPLMRVRVKIQDFIDITLKERTSLKASKNSTKGNLIG